MTLPRARVIRAAFSMIEVMIAITVLAVAITAILGNYQTLNSARQDTAARGGVAELGRAILDRIIAADTRALGEPNLAAGITAQRWSLPRYEDLPGERPPLMQQAANPDDDLVLQGLVDAPLPIPGLRVFIEYYHGIDVVDPVTGDVLQLGVMGENNFNALGDFRASFENPAWRAARRMATNQTPFRQVAEDDPIVIRVIVSWEANQRLVFYTTRRRPPGA